MSRILLLHLTGLVACSTGLSDSPPQALAPLTPASSSIDSPGPIFGETDSPGTGSSQLTGEGCAEVTASTEVLPAVLQLLVDTSGSMNDRAPGAGSSKWDVTRAALLDAVEGIPAEAALGVLFYPNVAQNAEPCFARETAVAIDTLGALGSAHRQAIAQAFATEVPQGGTPTHDAYQFAISELRASPAVGRQFVVLITDGVPTFSLGCVAGEARGFGPFQQQQPVDAAPLIAEAATALSGEVRTFVIGSPGSEDGRESLSRMAEAAGTAKLGCSHQGPSYCHFDMTVESDLSAGLEEALRTITGTALSCDYPLPPAPPGSLLDLDQVSVTFTPPAGESEELARTGNNCADGWQYAQNQTHVVLCPGTCERVRRSRGEVTLRLGCTTVVR